MILLLLSAVVRSSLGKAEGPPPEKASQNFSAAAEKQIPIIFSLAPPVKKFLSARKSNCPGDSLIKVQAKPP
jgi:hypothetical protein